MMAAMAGAPDPGMTIECREVVELVTDYLEGALDPDTTTELEAHLRLCEGCEEYLAQLRTTLDAVGHIPLDGLSEGAKATLLAAFQDVQRPS
jgi:anti-sigma factor RsiW